VLEKVLEQLKIPILVIGIDSDILYPPAEQQELADALPLGELQIIESKHGHDAFLINFDQILAHFHPFAQRTGLYSLKESKEPKNSTA
jgi:homoserine O-acetyltransferase